MRRFRLGIAAAAVAALIAACGASSSTVTHTVDVPQTVTVTDTVTVPATTATTTPSSTSTSAGTGTSTAGTGTTTSASGATHGTSACTASDLTPKFLGSNGATGRVVLAFALLNHSNSPCHTYGWPGVQFANAGGAALPTTASRTTSDLLGSTPAAILTLGPGQQASFRIIVADSKNGSDVACSTASQVRIIAPDDTATIVVDLTAPVTECGTATLSPLLSGSDAQPGV